MLNVFFEDDELAAIRARARGGDAVAAVVYLAISGYAPALRLISRGLDA